jgi:hypothetical protein
MLDCSGSDEPDAVVDGWIQRQVIKIHPLKQSTNRLDQYNFYLKNHLWYDAVNYLAQLHLQYPHDLEIQLTWRDLLNKLDKE